MADVFHWAWKASLLMTSREVITDKRELCSGGNSIVLTTGPRYILAKGTISCSNTASKALEAKHAKVVGQALAGVPLWEPALESRHPGVPYIVFPGKFEFLFQLFCTVSHSYEFESSTSKFSLGIVGDNNPPTQADILPSRRNLLLVGIVSKILPLVSFSDTDNMIRIKHVEKGEYAVGAFNVYNMEGVEAIVADEEEYSPVILQDEELLTRLA
ncbi:Ketose-bisphosphate aldolase, class-II [Melia azedarach]|uniref:Ketose-bisphosphate aldolase, class-II n=1 Tax=Melia azedarach TaxID=155640 RepID=A0ACC1YH72_MELAZ|nr:Ketose-bisphosphate aldolase, class-II [Melia azedarach]